MTDDTRLALGVPVAGGRAAVSRAGDLVRRVGPVEAADRVKSGGVAEELARRTEARRGIDCAAADLEVLARAAAG